MPNEDQYRALSDQMLQQRQEAPNDLAAESAARAAAAYRTAARMLRVANNKRRDATGLRQLGQDHFRRGNHAVASYFGTQAMTKDAAVEALVAQAENLVQEAVAHQADIRDATPPPRATKRSLDNTKPEE